MNWFFFAFIAPFLWSLVNISDQYLVSKYTTEEKGPGALVLFSSFIGVLVSLVISIFVKGFFNVSTLDKFLLVISGVFTILWVILYLYALETDDVSSVVPWFVVVPVFGYILGYFFLGEDLSLYQKIGSLVILVGAFILSLDFSENRKYIFKWKTVFYMLPASVLLAVIGIIFKYVTVVDSFWISSFWVYAGLGLSGIIIYIFSKNYRKGFLNMLKKGGRTIFALNVTSETLTVLGNLASSYATLLAPVALVLMVGNFQPAVLLIMTVLGTKLFPNIVKEDISRRVLVPKIIAIVFMIFGSAFLFV